MAAALLAGPQLPNLGLVVDGLGGRLRDQLHADEGTRHPRPYHGRRAAHLHHESRYARAVVAGLYRRLPRRRDALVAAVPRRRRTSAELCDPRTPGERCAREHPWGNVPHDGTRVAAPELSLLALRQDDAGCRRRFRSIRAHRAGVNPRPGLGTTDELLGLAP